MTARILAFAAGLVVAAALLMAATGSASDATAGGPTERTAGGSSYVYGWTDKFCTHIGGNNNLGGFGIDIFIRENDFSGTNYFVLLVRVERFFNGSWHPGESFAFRRPSNANFPNDSRDFQSTVEFFGSFENDDRGFPTRFKVTWQWWDSRSGPDFRLAQAVKRFRCDPPD